MTQWEHGFKYDTLIKAVSRAVATPISLLFVLLGWGFSGVILCHSILIGIVIYDVVMSFAGLSCSVPGAHMWLLGRYICEGVTDIPPCEYSVHHLSSRVRK